MKLSGVLLHIMILLSVSVALAQRPDDLVLTGTLNGAAVQHGFVEVPFSVPPGIERVTLLSFQFTHAEEMTKLDLGLYDPQRFRGWSGGNKHSFTVGISDATPSYLPGPIVPGTWKLIIGVANLRHAENTQYTAIIHLTPDGKAGPETFADRPLSTEARWYRGDLHMHTAHSDGSCTSQTGVSVPCPVFVTVEAAVKKGLDFIAITDHNTTSQYDAERELQPYFDRLLLIPAREMTTYSGHTNFFGSTHFIDFRTGAPGLADVNQLFREAHQFGEVVSINHPIGPSGEVCIGCSWSPPSTDMRLVDAIEVINGPDTGPSAAYHQPDVDFWQQQLNAGYRITAIGGSDTHRPELGTTGMPTTVVYAKELSVSDILDGVRSGRVFVDVQGSRDRILEMTASVGSTQASMGGMLAAPDKVTVDITAHVVHCAGLMVRFIVDGKSMSPSANGSIDRDDQKVDFHLVSDGKSHWVRVNVLDAARSLQLIGNPVYVNYKEKH